MAPIDIGNIALSILGKPPITSFLQGTNAAQVINVEYDPLRRALLEGPSTWRFSVKRASLPVLSTAPTSGPYTQQYAMPSDCLRVLLAGDTYPGLELSDYRLGPTDAGYEVEGRNILCDYGAPLSLKYVYDVQDITLWNPQACIALACDLAYTCCERLTGSDAKQAAAKARKAEAFMLAKATNAFENTPQFNADDTWVASRMQ